MSKPNLDKVTRITTGSNGRWFDYDHRGHHSNWQATPEPEATQAPAPAPPAPQPVTHAPGDPQAPARRALEGAEHELRSNPIGMSSAARQLLRSKWGEAKYRERYREAVHASGQLNMKVTR